MRIECLEARISTTDADTGQHYQLTQGDVVSVPDAFGRRLCDRGWAKDVDGQHATGPRTTVPVQVNPKTVTVTAKVGG